MIVDLNNINNNYDIFVLLKYGFFCDICKYLNIPI